MTVVVPAAGSYVIDPAESVVAFTAKHQFGLATVRGKFELRSGVITVADPATESHVEAVADATSFATGNKTRDGQVLSRTFLHADEHPDISFSSTAARVDASGTWTLDGTLTARTGAAPVSFTVVESTVDGDDLRLVATGVVDRYAHGITALKGITGRRLNLTLTVHAKRN